MSAFKAGDKVVVNSSWGRFMGIIDAINASNVLVSYIAESGDVCSTWFNLDQIALYDPPEFGIIGEHHA